MMRFVFCLILCCCTRNFVHAGDRPNFVWLISEDNSKHFLKLFDEHGAKTPAIEKLAESGLIFENAFSNSPVCSVARTTLITGCYAPRIGTQFHRRSVTVPMPPGLKMFPAYLRDAGYFTANNRKKDYNAIEGDGVWDESSGKATWRHRKSGQPFFYKQSFGTTHESSLHFPKRVFQKEATKTDPGDVFVAPYHPDTKLFRYTYARYHDRIQQVDAQIGKVVGQLAADDLLDDTFIFYFGDHGGVLPRGKGYAYESGLHVPLVVHVPRNFQHLVAAKPGSRVKGFVSFIDFGPTLLNLAGLEVPDNVDGRAFLGKDVSLEKLNQRDEAFGYADRFDEKYDLVRTLRKGRFEYVRNFQPFNFDGLQNNYRYKMLAYEEWRALFQAGKLNDVQSQFFRTRPAEALYDIESDPHETKNLADDPAYANTLSELRTRMNERLKAMPDLSLFPESDLVARGFSAPVTFGQQNQAHAAKLLDTANLSLGSFESVQTQLKNALQNEDWLIRYWACISASVHGAKARSFLPIIEKLAESDSSRLVRTRAAEFLGLTGLGNPVPVIMDCLAKSPEPVEANLILNSLVMLRDGERAYKFDVSWNSLPLIDRRGKSAMDVQRRMDYLAP